MQNDMDSYGQCCYENSTKKISKKMTMISLILNQNSDRTFKLATIYMRKIR